MTNQDSQYRIVAGFYPGRYDVVNEAGETVVRDLSLVRATAYAARFDMEFSGTSLAETVGYANQASESVTAKPQAYVARMSVECQGTPLAETIERRRRQLAEARSAEDQALTEMREWGLALTAATSVRERLEISLAVLESGRDAGQMLSRLYPGPS